MNALDAKRQQLEFELASVPQVDSVRLHPGMAETYRVGVRELVAGLSALRDEASALEARGAVRAFVSRIVLTPEAVSGRKLSEVRIDLEGALASPLHLAAGAGAAAAGVEFATQRWPPRGSKRARATPRPITLRRPGTTKSPPPAGRALSCVCKCEERWLRGQDLNFGEQGQFVSFIPVDVHNVDATFMMTVREG